MHVILICNDWSPSCLKTRNGNIFEGGEGAVDSDAVASNCSTGSCVSNFNNRINSKSSN